MNPKLWKCYISIGKREKKTRAAKVRKKENRSDSNADGYHVENLMEGENFYSQCAVYVLLLSRMIYN